MDKPPVVVDLDWTGELTFGARVAQHRLVLDSDSSAGPSPMQVVAMGLAGCMAMDVVHIVRKGRHDLRTLRARLTGRRAGEEPRRFVRIELHFEITGAVPPDALERAIALSQEKYCSVWHSLRQDIELETTFEIASESPG
jgi:putative redox protein